VGPTFRDLKKEEKDSPSSQTRKKAPLKKKKKTTHRGRELSRQKGFYFTKGGKKGEKMSFFVSKGGKGIFPFLKNAEKGLGSRNQKNNFAVKKKGEGLPLTVGPRGTHVFIG